MNVSLKIKNKPGENTVKPHLVATSLIKSPCYSSQVQKVQMNFPYYSIDLIFINRATSLIRPVATYCRHNIPSIKGPITVKVAAPVYLPKAMPIILTTYFMLLAAIMPQVLNNPICAL